VTSHSSGLLRCRHKPRKAVVVLTLCSAVCRVCPSVSSEFVARNKKTCKKFTFGEQDFRYKVSLAPFYVKIKGLKNDNFIRKVFGECEVTIMTSDLFFSVEYCMCLARPRSSRFPGIEE